MSHDENRLDLAGLTADEVLAINSVLARDADLRKREDKRIKWLKFKTVGSITATRVGILWKIEVLIIREIENKLYAYIFTSGKFWL